MMGAQTMLNIKKNRLLGVKITGDSNLLKVRNEREVEDNWLKVNNSVFGIERRM